MSWLVQGFELRDYRDYIGDTYIRSWKRKWKLRFRAKGRSKFWGGSNDLGFVLRVQGLGFGGACGGVQVSGCGV